MLVSTKAIVLSAIKYGEADLIVTCYTLETGVKSYLLRNVIKSKKGKLRRSFFLPLTQLHIEAYHKNKGNLEKLTEAKVIHPYTSLHTHIVKSSIVLFLAELLKKTLQEEEPNSNLYSFIEHSMQWLDSSTEYANFHIYFMLQLTRYLGFYPDTSNIAYSYFNIEEGTFQNSPPLNHHSTIETTTLFKGFLGTNFDALMLKKISKKDRADLLNLLILYYKLHLHSFNQPKSLEVLQQLFK